MQRELLARRAFAVLITNCGCLGPCFDGPNAVVYPDGVWYAGLQPDDAAGIADHLVAGRVLAAKVSQRPGAEPASDPVTEGEAESEGDADGNAGRR